MNETGQWRVASKVMIGRGRRNKIIENAAHGL
jgi:hypothetical protein